MKTFIDISYQENAISAQKLDLYIPDCDSFPVFIYFHGGGLVYGDKADQSQDFKQLASVGIAVASVNYRMYPNARFPDYLNDAAKAVRWVFDNIGSYGHARAIFVGGSSAGGYISQMICFDKRYLKKVGLKPTDVTAYVHDAGQPTTHFNILKKERALNENRVIVDEAAPLYHVGEDEKYSPMLLIVSDGDMANRYEQTMLLKSALANFGHTDDTVTLKVMHGGHCHYLNTQAPDGRRAFGAIVEEYVNKILDKRGI